jgi:hypothetical protein
MPRRNDWPPLGRQRKTSLEYRLSRIDSDQQLINLRREAWRGRRGSELNHWFYGTFLPVSQMMHNCSPLQCAEANTRVFTPSVGYQWRKINSKHRLAHMRWSVWFGNDSSLAPGLTDSLRAQVDNAISMVTFSMSRASHQVNVGVWDPLTEIFEANSGISEVMTPWN